MYSLADIVTGHGNRLGQDGMLAEPRHLEKLLGFVDTPLDTVVDPFEQSCRTDLADLA